MIRRVLLSASVLLAVVAACSNDDEGTVDTGVDSGTNGCINPHPENIPAPSDPCLAGCGNELGVGQPCSKGNGECSDFAIGQAIFCTADFDDTVDLKFCTRPCTVDDQCGANARCAVDPQNPASGSGCFPRSCDSPGDLDASTSTDAG